MKLFHVAATLLTSASWAGVALAQDVAPVLPVQESASKEAQLEEGAPDIVVTGIRESLRSNAQNKKNSPEIVDTITATDIGKLPDPNVAETLTRVPGVQAYRFGGEAASPVGVGSGLTVRGLTGQTASRTNGRALFTAGQRDFNIEGITPAIVAGVDVFKNPAAEHIEGGIGGIVNVRTRKPLDFKGLTMTASAGARYNDLAEQARPEVFGLVSNRWDIGDGELGVLLAGSFLQTVNRGDNTPGSGGILFRRAINGASSEYAQGAAAGLYNASYIGRSDVAYLADVNPGAVAGDRSQLISVLGQTPTTAYEKYIRTRKGLNGMLQYKPNPDLEIYVEGLFNWYRYHQEFGFLGATNSRYVGGLETRAFQATEGLANRNINGGTNDLLAGRLLTGGTFLGSSLSVTSGLVNNTYWTAQGAVGAHWKADENLTLDLDLSYVKARVNNDGRALTFLPAQGSSWDLTRDLSARPTTLTIGGSDPSLPTTWVYGQYNSGPNMFEDDGVAAKIDLTRSFDGSFIRKIKAGLRFATQNDTFRNFAYSGKQLTTDGAALAANRSNAISVAGSGGVTTIAPNNFMDGQAGYAGGFLIYEPEALGGDRIRSLFPQAGIPPEGSEVELLANRRRFEEKTYGGYVSADFAALNDLLRGSLGVRMVRTDTYTRALIDTGSGIVPNEVDSSYTDVLPTANITATFAPNTLLRLGYGRGITRPDPGSLNPSVVANAGNGGASIGNAELKPQKGDSYDLSLEHYFSGSSYVSAGLFYKSVSGFFSSVASCQTLPGFTYTGPILNGCSNGQYLVTQTVNAATGDVKGLELAAQTFFDFDFVPTALRNFGASGSFTVVDTMIPVRLASGIIVKTQQPFTSKYSYTLAGFYEDDTLSARIVYTHRSPAQFTAVGLNPVDSRYIQGFGLLDASLNVNLPHNLQVSLTASNLTNAAPNRFFGEPNFYTGVERQHYVNGRTFGAALRWKFGG